MKFAYLVMAHENSVVLRSLLKLIDDERNDIFIHIDGKQPFDFKADLENQIKRSNLYFTTRRINVEWANISQVESEYVLFADAFSNKKYDYYHLISGADLPIKSQEQIHTFFENHQGKEFIGFAERAVPHRLIYKHLFSREFRSRSKTITLLRTFFILLQKYIGYNKFSDLSHWEIKNGTNWVSITHDFVSFLLSNKELILSKMKYAKSPDEYYKQILAYNSNFRGNLFCLEEEFNGCQRLIDWNRGKPYEWKSEDLSELISSDKMFARKFGKVDTEIVEKIEKTILKGSC